MNANSIDRTIMRTALHEAVYVSGVYQTDAEPKFDEETSTLWGDIDLDNGATLRLSLTLAPED